MKTRIVKISAFLWLFFSLIARGLLARYKGAFVGETFFVVTMTILIVGVVIYIIWHIRHLRNLREKADVAKEYAKASAQYHGEKFRNAEDLSAHSYGKSRFSDNEIFEEYTRERNEAMQKLSTQKVVNGKFTFKGLKKMGKLPIIAIVLLIAVLKCSGSMFTSTANFMAMLTMIGGFGFFAGAIVILFIYRYVKQRDTLKQDSVIFTKLIPNEVGKLFGNNSNFVKNSGIAPDKISRMNCFRSEFHRIYGSNLVTGTYGGRSFEAAQHRLEREYKEKDEDGREYIRRETVFNGLIIGIDYPKKSASPLGLCSKNENEICTSRTEETKNGKISHTENENFHTLFYTNSSDEENLFYILTPDVMDRLAALYDEYKNFYLYFEGGRVYFALHSYRSFLNITAVNPTEEEIGRLMGEIDRQLIAVRKKLDMLIGIC